MPSLFWLLPLLLWNQGVAAGKSVSPDLSRVEVFALSGQPIVGSTAAIAPQVDLQQYELDRIRLIETRLSRDLPADPKQAQTIVLDRFQHLDPATNDSLRQSAAGLTQAMQYGIDRVPAIVFNGQAVVYGVTDVSAALVRYRDWRMGKRP